MAQTTEPVVKSTRYIKIYDIWHNVHVHVYGYVCEFQCDCECVCISRHINTSHRQIVFPIFAQRRSWQLAVPHRPPQSVRELELEFELESELELELESELLKSTQWLCVGFVLQ